VRTVGFYSNRVLCIATMKGAEVGLVLSVFLASLVEAVEAVTIVAGAEGAEALLFDLPE